VNWKIPSLQSMLDALFDEAWCQLGLPERLSEEDALENTFPPAERGLPMGSPVVSLG